MFLTTKRLCIFTLIWSLSITLLFSQKTKWIELYQSKVYSYLRGLETDSLNNYYVLCEYTDTLNVENSASHFSNLSAGRNYCLIKYNCENILQWFITIKGAERTNGGSIIIAPNGNIYIVGEFKGTSIFENSDKSIFAEKIANSGNYFTAKLNSKGFFEWVAISEVIQSRLDPGKSVSIDASENIYFSSVFSKNAKFYSTTGTNIITKNGSQYSNDIFIVKYNKNGIIQFVQTAGGPNDENIRHSAIDSKGNLYLSGGFGCCTEEFTSFGEISIKNKASFGGFIGKLSPTGQWLWVNYMGENGNELFNRICVDNTNNFIYTIGNSTLNTNFNTQSSNVNFDISTPDIVLAKIDLNGNLLWAKKFGGVGNENGLGICLRKNGNPVISGYFSNTLMLDSITISTQAIRSGFIAEINGKNGQTISAKKIGNQQGVNYVYQMAMSPNGISYIGGNFTNDLSIDNLNKNSTHNSNNYVASFEIVEKPNIESTLFCIDSIMLTINNKTEGNFKWFRNDTLVRTTNIPIFSTNIQGIYYVVNIQNCLSPDTSNKLSLNYDPLIVDLPKNISACKGDIITILVQTNANRFLWMPSNIFNNDTILSPSILVDSTRYLYLTSYLGNCIKQDSILLTVNKLNVSIKPIMPIKSGQSISLQASGADSYIWSPNQFINNVNTPNPEVNPPETKLYSVLGSVNNCLAKDSILVIVEGTEGLIMPNAFTPQGDGLNETFAPAFIGSFEFIKLSIYSRWGELLHQTVYPGGSWWNGTYKGVPCQDGVYFFRLEAKTNQGKEYFHSGNVTLIR